MTSKLPPSHRWVSSLSPSAQPFPESDLRAADHGGPQNGVEFGVGQKPLQSTILLIEILQQIGQSLFRRPPYCFFFSRVRLLRHTDLLDRLGNRLTCPHLDFDARSIGDDLVGQFFLYAWHGMPSFGFDTTRLSLWKWCRLRGAGHYNLRASRETELVERFPLQAVMDWMGNTPKVALRHYLMTTDTHFDAAVRGDEEALQNALQQSHAMGGLEPRPHDPIKKAPVLQGLAGSCVLTQPPQVAGTGSEQTRFRSGERGVASACDAKCDAISANRIELLTRAVILVAGMNLAEAERAAVLARVIADLTSPTQRIPE